MTRKYRNMKMHNQNNALLDTPQAVLSLFLDILTCFFDLLNKYINRYWTAFFCLKENA